jgi:hypothetical protein
MRPDFPASRLYYRVTIVVGVACVGLIALILASATPAGAAEARKISCNSVSKRLQEGGGPLACRIPTGLAPARPF